MLVTVKMIVPLVILHNRATAVLLLCLRVEHLALCAQAIRLGHQAVDLLSSLEDRFDCLVKHNLGLIKLLLNL